MTAWPGLARLTMDALQQRDRFLVAGCALFGAAFIAAGNLAADVAAGGRGSARERADVNPRRRASARRCWRPSAAIAICSRRCWRRTAAASNSPIAPMRRRCGCTSGARTAGSGRSSTGRSIEDRIGRTYREDRATLLPIEWFARGRLVSLADEREPLLLLGADALGRDILSRLIYGAQLSLGVVLAGVLGALAIGGLAGAIAGSLGGATDSILMLIADFLLVLPGAYLVLVLRSLLPAGPLDRRSVWADGGALRDRGLAAHRARRARDRPDRAPARLRGGGARDRRRPVPARAPSAAGGVRVSRRRDRAADSGAARRRSDAVVSRSGLSGAARRAGARCCRKPPTSASSTKRPGCSRRPARCSSSSSAFSSLAKRNTAGTGH